jgi:hypothetical protein
MEKLNNKFKMKGTCVLKEDIVKGEFHYSPWTESKKGSVFEYVRKYSKHQKDNNECSKKDVPDRVILYSISKEGKNKKFLETNDYILDVKFSVDIGFIWG